MTEIDELMKEIDIQNSTINALHIQLDGLKDVNKIISDGATYWERKYTLLSNNINELINDRKQWLKDNELNQNKQLYEDMEYMVKRLEYI